MAEPRKHYVKIPEKKTLGEYGHFLWLDIATGELTWVNAETGASHTEYLLNWNKQPSSWKIKCRYQNDCTIGIELEEGEIDWGKDGYKKHYRVIFDKRHYSMEGGYVGIWIDYKVPRLKKTKDIAYRYRTVLGGYGTVDLVDVRPNPLPMANLHHAIVMPAHPDYWEMEIRPVPDSIFAVGDSPPECHAMEVRFATKCDQHFGCYAEGEDIQTGENPKLK